MADRGGDWDDDLRALARTVLLLLRALIDRALALLDRADEP